MIKVWRDIPMTHNQCIRILHLQFGDPVVKSHLLLLRPVVNTLRVRLIDAAYPCHVDGMGIEAFHSVCHLALVEQLVDVTIYVDNPVVTRRLSNLCF